MKGTGRRKTKKTLNEKSFIESQFGYFPLARIFCGRKTNARINYIYDRAFENSLQK